MKLILKRLSIIATCGILLLFTAQSCSIPGINLFNNNSDSDLRYGILKRDPSILETGFGFINGVKSGDDISDNALQNFSVSQFEAFNKDVLFALTKEKGLFVSENGGQYWTRKYVYPLTDSDSVDDQIARNDAFSATSFVIKDARSYYISGIDSDNRGKVFKTTDGGKTFDQVYSEFEEEISVNNLTIDPNNTQTVYATLSGGAMIRTSDNGLSWKKVQSFKNEPVQIGFIPQINNILFALFPKDGLQASTDQGENWDEISTYKSKSTIGERLERDTLNLNPLDRNQTFGEFTKIVPVLPEIQNQTFPALLIADSQAWYSTDLYTQKFIKIPLPVQNEKNSIFDIQYNPSTNSQNLFAAVNNQLIESIDGGQNWKLTDAFNLNDDIEIGNISSINFDPQNSNVMYITLTKDENNKRRGLFGR